MARNGHVVQSQKLRILITDWSRLTVCTANLWHNLRLERQPDIADCQAALYGTLFSRWLAVTQFLHLNHVRLTFLACIIRTMPMHLKPVPQEAPTSINNTQLLLLHPFNNLYSRSTWVCRDQKSKTSMDLIEARDDGVLGCSGISWTICKQSTPCSRQITTSTPHHSNFTGRMLFLMPNQQCQSTQGIY